MPQGKPTDLGFRLSIGVPLLLVTFGAWYLSAALQTSSEIEMGSPSTAIPILTMASMFRSLHFGIVSAFLMVWVVGMVAMMFPAMIPVICFYSEMTRRDEKRQGPSRILASALFLGGYLSLYALLGLAMFAVVHAIFQTSSIVTWPPSSLIVGVASILIIAGIWQLTPLKEKSLAKCISPIGFFSTHRKKGLSGAFRMGADHGIYCIGCCWMYTLAMLGVAAMSLLSMTVLSGLIVVEKAFLGGTSWFKWLSAGLFILLGMFVIFFPSFLTLF